MHAAAAVAGEAVAAMHGAAVVPDDQIADLPPLGPGELVARGMRPELVQQRLALLQRQRRDVGAEAAAEEQRLAPGLGMGAHDRVDGARQIARIVALEVQKPGRRWPVELWLA